MIHPAHLRRVIQETLGRMGAPYDSPAATELLMLTAAHESRLGTYLWQLGNDGEPRGPALGIYQMEPATHRDLWENWLGYRSAAEDALLLGAGFGSAVLAASIEGTIAAGEKWLVSNLGYATAAARLQYYRAPERLPEADDIEGLAGYWHRHWCRGCKGTAAQAAADYRELVLGGGS